MKITICDICNNDGKIEKASWRVGHKNPTKGISFRIDTCRKHKDVFQGKDFETNYKFYLDLQAKQVVASEHV